MDYKEVSNIFFDLQGDADVVVRSSESRVFNNIARYIYIYKDSVAKELL